MEGEFNLSMNELVSIIVPVYNVEKYLEKCILSVLSQTYTNIEVILVDDGSTDDSLKICETYAKLDNRISVIHKQNGGLSSARNAGLDIARGDFISFIDSDDYVDSRFIENLYNRIISDGSDIAVCEYSRVDEKGDSLPYIPFNKDIVVNEDQFWNLFCSTKLSYCVISCNKLYKARLWKNIRFKVGKLNEDAFIIKEIISQCDKISLLSKQLYFYFIRNGSIMNNYTERSLDNVEAYLEILDYLILHKYGSYSKGLLNKIASHLHIAHIKLGSESIRYQKVRKEYKSAYKKVYKNIEIGKPWFHCTLYYCSDNMYALYCKISDLKYKIKTTIMDMMKKNERN